VLKGGDRGSVDQGKKQRLSEPHPSHGDPDHAGLEKVPAPRERVDQDHAPGEKLGSHALGGCRKKSLLAQGEGP